MGYLNCWEYKKCGREIGGSKENELGVCSAAVEKRLEGINNGKNGGRACWVLVGTLCRGKVQGTFATKIADCMICEFYKLVNTEEGKKLTPTKDLLAKLK